MPRIAVALNARDEENHIADTLISLQTQTIPLEKIVLCNDRSIDTTKTIAEDLGVQVVDFPYDHENWVSFPQLALTINMALDELKDGDYDYVLLSGGDCIYSKDYIERLIQKMKEDNTVIVSGEDEDEKSVVPRGSGRLIDFKWWKKYGLNYPVTYSWETWLLFKANQDGYTPKIYHEISFKQTRKTGSNYTRKTWFNRGRAMKSLGYNKRFVLGRSIILLTKKHQLINSLYIIAGYMKNVDMCDEQLCNYVRTLQNESMSIRNTKHLVKRFLEIQQ